MPQFILQSNFKFGEVSPLLFARSDSQIYYNGVRRLRNCLVLPQGGARRRFGTTFIRDLTSLESNYLNYKPFFFVHSDGSKYLLLFTALKITIIRNGTVVATVVTTYTAANVKTLDVAQSNELVFITVAGKSPAILSRTSAHAGWSLNASPTFTHQPTYDFKQNYDSANFTIYLAGSTTILTDATNQIARSVIVNCSTAIFGSNNDYVGGLYFGASGTVRFTSRIDASNMNGKILKTFNDKAALLDSSLSAAQRIITGQQSVVTEKMFSATRGWPEKVSFFQNRLWFAKTVSLPGLVTGSNYNGFTSGRLNFDDSRTLETSAVSTVLYGRKATLINHIISYKSLVIFTTSGVYSTSLDLLEPITPLNINFMNLQTGDITSNLLPNILNNSVIFYDKGGSRVKTLILTDDGNNYQAGTLNILSPHLIDTPYSSAVMDSSSTIDGSYLFIINNGSERKGQLAIYNLVEEQGITAWTLNTTGIDADNEGFRHVISDGEDVFFITERTVNSSQKIYLEQLSFDHFTDSSIDYTQSSSKTITGLSHLEGLEVEVWGGTSSDNEGYEGSFTVASGQVTIDHEVTQGYVGIKFTPLIGTLPLMVATEFGNNVYRPKHIKNVYIDFYKSIGITVNNTKLPYFNEDSNLMNTALVPQTNYDEVAPMSGWDPRTEIVISQDTPHPFTILGIGMTVEA